MNKYQLVQGPDSAWSWRLRASNGRVVASGEGYKREADAYLSVLAHRRCATIAKLPVLTRLKRPDRCGNSLPENTQTRA